MNVGPGRDFSFSFIHLFSSFQQGLGSFDRSDQICLDFLSSRLKFLPDSFAFFCKHCLGGIWRGMNGGILVKESFSMAYYCCFGPPKPWPACGVSFGVEVEDGPAFTLSSSSVEKGSTVSAVLGSLFRKQFPVL